MTAALVLVGGGLANCLIAYRILREDPDFPMLLIERENSLGANHTWSFHDSDLTMGQLEWIRPLVQHSWSVHELRFPRRRRVFRSGYNSITSKRLDAVVRPMLGDRALVGVQAVEVAPDKVRIDDGGSVEARAVIDGRGPLRSDHLDVAFQKFVGLFVRVERGHGLDGPILMDATVQQRDGYRFVYTLPLSDADLLIEDTYYSDTAELDLQALRAGIKSYASEEGWTVSDVTGEERGVLPIVLGGDILGYWGDGPAGVARSGMRAALFHPTTGYSLPEAVRLADEIAAHRHSDGSALFELTRRRSLDLWRRHGFFRFLNRMLFRAAEPDHRYRIFERFYRLRQGLIERFYGGRLEFSDKARLLTGRPPVPIHRAIPCIFEGRRRATGPSTARTS